MAHQFTVKATIHKKKKKKYKSLVADVALQEPVCKRIPGVIF